MLFNNKEKLYSPNALDQTLNGREQSTVRYYGINTNKILVDIFEIESS